MKFKELYQNIKPIFEEHNGIILGRQSKPCHICKEATPYVEIHYEGHFCSEECVLKLDEACSK